MASDLTWAEPARELERQPDTRKDDGAVKATLEARRVPGDSRTRMVVLDRGQVSDHTLIPHATTPHPAHVRRRATPPLTSVMTLSTRAAPCPKMRTDHPHAPAGTRSRPPGGVIPWRASPRKTAMRDARASPLPGFSAPSSGVVFLLANDNPTGAPGVKARLAALISAKEKRPASDGPPLALKPFFLSLRAWTPAPSGLGPGARKPHKPDDSRRWESGESP